MGRQKKQDGDVNKSQAIRDLLKEKPDIKAGEAISLLAGQGVKVASSLFYLVKGNVLGRKSRLRKNKKNAVNMMAVATPATGKSDALATIRKIKVLAAEVGGLGTLKALVEALSE